MYTDFVVREIDEFGNIAKLTNISHHNIGIIKYIRFYRNKSKRRSERIVIRRNIFIIELLK